jgi:hypothetical protein
MMRKITDWVINNSLLGSLINVFLGDNWREERPRTAAVVYTFFAVIYLMAFAGFLIGILSV